ncbi:uncharacterized protein [Salminus brasiliensis]|uniref:uncharacterized protein n=1 Tax=Salminus brasiliensis TaxID=930266 RepID=UPI003B833665
MVKFIWCSSSGALHLVLFVFVGSLKVGDNNNNSTGALTPDNKQDCTTVFCQNGTITLELNESMVEERRDCKHGLYNETGHFLGEADQSGLMNLSCQSHNYIRQVTWKIMCGNETLKSALRMLTMPSMDEEVCFRIQGRAEEVEDDQHCRTITCQNGIATLELNESMVEERRDCEHMLYNETGHFLGEADQSGLKNLSCQSHNYTRQVTWKIRCDDKTMDEEVCFRIEDRAEEVSSEPLEGRAKEVSSEPHCTTVICQNDTVTPELDKSIVKECRDCEHGLYNETGHFLGEADQSGLIKLSCQPHNYTRQVTWKIRCEDKTMDEEVCFRNHPDKVNDDQCNCMVLAIVVSVTVIVAVILIVLMVFVEKQKYLKWASTDPVLMSCS